MEGMQQALVPGRAELPQLPAPQAGIGASLPPIMRKDPAPALFHWMRMTLQGLSSFLLKKLHIHGSGIARKQWQAELFRGTCGPHAGMRRLIRLVEDFEGLHPLPELSHTDVYYITNNCYPPCYPPFCCFPWYLYYLLHVYLEGCDVICASKRIFAHSILASPGPTGHVFFASPCALERFLVLWFEAYHPSFSMFYT